MHSNHGGDIYHNRVRYDFSVNVNPFGLPESCREAVIRSLSMASCYPDCAMEELREGIAGKELKEGASFENVILGNGASELIYGLCQALKPKTALVTAPAFTEYEEGARVSGSRILYEPLREEEGFVVTERILSKIGSDTELLFLCNPNNPTGAATEKELLLRAAERCEESGTFFLLDECFLPFMKEEENYTLRNELQRFPHLMILKAYTKIFGMAGIRFGYLLSSNKELLKRIRQTMQPWNVSVPAQAAAEAALKEDAFVQKTKALVEKERKYLLSELSKLEVDVVGRPAANFILFRDAPSLADRFLEKGVLIRRCGNFNGLSEEYFRIGVRSPEENRALIRIWKEIRKEYNKTDSTDLQKTQRIGE